MRVDRGYTVELPAAMNSPDTLCGLMMGQLTVSASPVSIPMAFIQVSIEAFNAFSPNGK
jgi:hypothetical protein